MGQWVSTDPGVGEYGALKTSSERKTNYFRFRIKAKGGWLDTGTFVLQCEFWFRNGEYGGHAKETGCFFDGVSNVTDSGTFTCESSSGTSSLKKTLWYVDEEAYEGKEYIVTGTIPNVKCGEITIIAAKGTVYTVTYDGNEADGGETEAQYKVPGETVAIEENGFTRQGYEFLRWNTDEYGLGTDYAPGDSYAADEDMTLYAQWKAMSIMHVNIGGEEVTVTEIYANRSGNAVPVLGVYRNNNGTAEQTL